MLQAKIMPQLVGILTRTKEERLKPLIKQEAEELYDRLLANPNSVEGLCRNTFGKYKVVGRDLSTVRHFCRVFNGYASDHCLKLSLHVTQPLLEQLISCDVCALTDACVQIMLDARMCKAEQ